MLTCQHCRIQLRGEYQRCPLCQGSLSGQADPGVFPLLHNLQHRRYTLLMHTLLFSSIVISVICLAINFLHPFRVFWSLFVVAGLACLWLCVWAAYRKHHNIPKTILWQAAICSLLSILWDYATHWHGWALNYAVPILFTMALLAIGAAAAILKLHPEDYMIYLLLAALLSVIPLLMLIFGQVRVRYPSVICVACSIISLAALAIFFGRSLLIEIKKRLHF